MTFNTKDFMREKFQPRTEAVDVPELKQWFGPNATPVWKVRCLEGEELARVKLAPERDRALLDLTEALASAVGAERQEALKKVMALSGGDLPEDYVKRLEILILGSVDPVCDRDLAKRIAKVYPAVFSRLTERILQLTGMGYEPGKPKSSGKTPASATP